MITIELSTVAFFEGQIPQTVALRDCSMRLPVPFQGGFLGFHGYQSKQEGFMAARAYADRHRLQFTVIDLLVEMETKLNPTIMKPADVPNHEFISLLRVSKAMTEELSEKLIDHLVGKGAREDQFDGLKAQQILGGHPDLIDVLMSDPDWAHFKVVVFPAKLEISEKPLALGLVPKAHWSSIREASCRLNPTVHVTLDAPGASPTSGAEVGTGLKPRKPRA